MNKKNDLSKFAIMFMPWALAEVFQGVPTVSYFTAWLGSFFIFFVTLSGKIKPIPTDRTLAEQLMRPIFIVQIIMV